MRKLRKSEINRIIKENAALSNEDLICRFRFASLIGTMATESCINAQSVARLFSFSETWKNIVTIVEEKSSGNFLQHFWTPTKNQNMILARKKRFYHFCVFYIGRLKREKKKQKWRIKNEAM